MSSINLLFLFLDENARKTFEVKVVVEKISNEPAQKVIDESPERGEMNILIEESVRFSKY